MDLLSPEIMQMILSQGIFAVLFVYMLLTERKDSRERENRLMISIEKNSNVYEKVIDSIDALRNIIINKK